jgi:hypothetical protein
MSSSGNKKTVRFAPVPKPEPPKKPNKLTKPPPQPKPEPKKLKKPSP